LFAAVENGVGERRWRSGRDEVGRHGPAGRDGAQRIQLLELLRQLVPDHHLLKTDKIKMFST
jgi:hypothetical protein